MLVTNVTVNPNDAERWDKEIVPGFRTIGIKATLWGLEQLNAILTKHPHVAEAYFEGENRCFLSLGEAYEVAKADEIGDSGLKVALSGRDAELRNIESFLQGPKKLLCVHGPGGIGKSRLLLEIGEIAEKRNHQVLWALEASMGKNSQWFSAVTYAIPTVLLVDEPQDPELVRVLVEQLRPANSHMQEWKVIIAVRSPNDPVLKAVTNMPGNLRENPVVLAPLTPELSKNLALSLINASTLSGLPGDRKDAIAEHLSRLGGRYPIWIAMAVNVLAKHGDLSALPRDADEVAARYLNEVIERSTTRAGTQQQIEILLRWLALYEEFNIEEIPVLTFVSTQAGFADQTVFHECLNSLVARKFVVRRGINDRLYAIKPDVMRDYVVRTWLIQQTIGRVEATAAARHLVDLIIAGYQNKPLPKIHSLIKALAKAEYFTGLQGTRLDFLSPLIAELTRLATSGTVLEQQAIVGFIGSFDFARLSDALEIICTIRVTETATASITDFFGKEHEVTHSSVVAQLAWPLFCAARYAATQTERQAVLKEMAALSMFEANLPDSPKNDGNRADALLPRIIAGENDFYFGYQDDAFAMAMVIAEKLTGQEALDDATLNLIKVLCSPFLSVERERTYFKQHMLSVNRWLILLNSPDGLKRNEMRIVLRECACNDRCDTKSRLLSWKLLSVAHSSANRALRNPKDEAEQAFAAEFRNDLKADLTWTLTTLMNHTLPLAELKAARSIWHWHDRFEKEGEIKAIAEQCEALYLRHPLVSMFHVLFSPEMYEQASQRAAEIGTELGATGNSASIREFVQQAEQFLSEDNNSGNILQVAQHAGSHWDMNKHIQMFVHDALKMDPKGLCFLFALTLLNRRLLGLRAAHALDGLTSELSNADSAIPTPDAKRTFLLQLYGQPHPKLRGVLTAADFQFARNQIEKSPETFDPVFKCQVLAGMYHSQWGVWKDYCEEICVTARDEIRPRCFLTLLHGIIFLALFGNEYPQLCVRPEHWAWLLDLMVTLPDVDEVDENHQWELEQLVQKFGTNDVDWLLTTIQRRINAFENKGADTKEGYKIVPTRHRLTRYVTSVPLTGIPSDLLNEQMSTLLGFAERTDLLGYILPKYASDIDPHGRVLPENIEQRLQFAKGKGKEAIWVWARFAGSYGFNSEPWRRIARATILALEGLPVRDRNSIFCDLLPQELKSSQYAAGEMDPRPGQDLLHRKHELQEEADETIRIFRQWHVAVAQAEYDQTVARYKEETEQ